MFKETEIGFEYLTNDFLAFFGKHNSQLGNLKKNYPYLDWAQLKQVHGDRVIQSLQPEIDQQEADAHWTTVSQLGLVTKTADCIPILAFNQASKAVLSIHAGWRGVANRIAISAFKKLSQKHPMTDWSVFIGPHIQKDSFEIQKDVSDLLILCTSLSTQDWLIPSHDGFKADLSRIIHQQLLDCGMDRQQIFNFNADTKTDLRFHSFRRDKELSGRQLSFIAKIH